METKGNNVFNLRNVIMCHVILILNICLLCYVIYTKLGDQWSLIFTGQNNKKLKTFTDKILYNSYSDVNKTDQSNYKHYKQFEYFSKQRKYNAEMDEKRKRFVERQSS